MTPNGKYERLGLAVIFRASNGFGWRIALCRNEAEANVYVSRLNNVLHGEPRLMSRWSCHGEVHRVIGLSFENGETYVISETSTLSQVTRPLRVWHQAMEPMEEL